MASLREYGVVAMLGASLTLSDVAGLAQTEAQSPDPWSYQGPRGPEQWTALAPAFAACGQREQSPIDLANAVPAQLGALAVDWRQVPLHVVRNGHAVEAEASDPGAVNRITLAGKDYRMVQFHLHHPSEHRINGRRYPLEVHFVHRSSSGALTVVGVLFTEGRANPALDLMIDHARSDDESDRVRIDPRQLLPARRTFFRYEGSLTTPPCSETVNWVVLATPLTASARQIAEVAEVYGDNACPIQPLGRRFLLVSQ
ncbi:carbonic anhydrase [Sphingomonas sp.]|uniref:carbonic anhydrase n=1 Tax=Sphingomonas sp. TaxID=28214 RepID=UPI0035A8413C